MGSKRKVAQAFVERIVETSRPIGVRYALTEKGLTVAKLGEPVFLYLRFKKGNRLGEGMILADASV